MEGNPLWGSWLLVGGPRVDSAGLRPASLTLGYRNAARFGAGNRQHKSEVKGQRSESRGRKTESRGRKTESRSQRSEVRGQRTEVNGQAASGLVVVSHGCRRNSRRDAGRIGAGRRRRRTKSETRCISYEVIIGRS